MNFPPPTAQKILIALHLFHLSLMIKCSLLKQLTKSEILKYNKYSLILKTIPLQNSIMSICSQSIILAWGFEHYLYSNYNPCLKCLFSLSLVYCLLLFDFKSKIKNLLSKIHADGIIYFHSYSLLRIYLYFSTLETEA